MKKILIPVAILIVGFLLMKLLASFREDPALVNLPPRAKIVDVNVIHLQDIRSEITAFGRLTSTQPVILYSEVSGQLLAGSVPFQPAQSFKKGDLLLKIDDRQIGFDLNGAKSDFLTALASVLPEIRVDFPQEYQVWQSYFDSINFKKSIGELPAVANQKIKLFLARFNVYKLFFTVRNLEVLLSKHFVIAPFDGSITSTDLRIGSTVRNGTKIGELISLETLEVEVPVPAHDLAWVEPGTPVVFTSTEIAGEWTGRIKRIGKIIDTRTQSVQVFMTINPGSSAELYAGIFLQANIPGKLIENAAVIPLQALYRDRYVYCIKDGLLDYREVGIARKETDSVILNSGLTSGDTLVVEVLQGVAPGMRARAKAATNHRDD